MSKPAPVQHQDDPETAALRVAVEEARKDIEAGRTIPHEEMRRWLLSWGTEQELPPPECK